jgi:hypothetical protein
MKRIGSWMGLMLGLCVAMACGRTRPLPGGESSNAGLNGGVPEVVRGFEGMSSLGRVRLTVYEGSPSVSDGDSRVGVMEEILRHSRPKESSSGLPVIEEYLETLPGTSPVYFVGGADPLMFATYVDATQAERVRSPLLRSVQKEFSRAVSYCSRFQFKGAALLKSPPRCQPSYYCQDLRPVELACSITGEGEGQCETGIFRLYLLGIPLMSRSFYQWILTEDHAFECLERRVGRTTPIYLSESDRMERLNFRIDPGARLRVRVPNPLPTGEPWMTKELKFLETSLSFSWDK